MKRVIALFLLVACTAASAEVFQRVGPDGELYFSDRPGPDAERVDVAPAQTISLPAVPQSSDGSGQSAADAADKKKKGPRYAQFSIVEPAEGESIRANDGSVTVSLSLQPPLVPGHTIELIVDGEDGENVHSGVSLSFNLADLSRGMHTLKARVKNGRGEPMNETGPVSFYILRVALGGG